MASEPLERGTMRAVSLRLLPFVLLLYVLSYLDRSNVSIAALQMNKELQFSSAAFGFGVGIFFLGYAVLEVPSNLILARVGARKWLARIMITWGLLASAMMFVRTPHEFYALRFLLGLAEAGFVPGVIYYLGNWFPDAYRSRAMGTFAMAVPLSSVLGGAIGGSILGLSGVAHLSGWQWLFLLEGLPSVLLGIVVFRYLTDRPEDARWLSPAQRGWLSERLERERQQTAASHGSPLRALANPLVWVLTIPYVVYFTIANAYLFWGPILIRDALHTSNVATGLVISGIALYSAALYPVSSILSDRWDERCGFPALGLAFAATGCVVVALLPHSPLRIAGFVVIAMCGPFLTPSFWCLPTKFLKGASAAAGIALINSVGTSGGFLGPNIVGLLKQATGSDVGAFYALAALALTGSLVCLGLRQMTVLGPARKTVRLVPDVQPT